MAMTVLCHCPGLAPGTLSDAGKVAPESLRSRSESGFPLQRPGPGAGPFYRSEGHASGEPSFFESQLVLILQQPPYLSVPCDQLSSNSCLSKQQHWQPQPERCQRTSLKQMCYRSNVLASRQCSTILGTTGERRTNAYVAPGCALQPLTKRQTT
jgi:hypothetical protein